MAYDMRTEKRVWRPEGEVRAVVQVIHGMAEHIDRYEAMAKHLNTKGIAVVGINLRGHGTNAEIKGWFAEKNGWGMLVEDHHALTNEIRREFPGVPLALLGHSMGSFLAREYAMRFSKDIDMLILSGTGHYAKSLCAAGGLLAKLSAKKKPANFVNGIAFTGNNKPFQPSRTDFDWLSRDEKNVDKYVADEYCGFTFTGSAFADFFGGLKALCDTKRLQAVRKDLPVLLISGACDPVGQMGEGVKITGKEYEDAGSAGSPCACIPKPVTSFSMRSTARRS
jgi:Lysophospholipase